MKATGAMKENLTFEPNVNQDDKKIKNDFLLLQSAITVFFWIISSEIWFGSWLIWHWLYRLN